MTKLAAADDNRPKRLVMNHEPRPHFIPPSSAPGCGKHKGVHLKPGINLVDAESWEEAKELEVVAHHLEEGHFEEIKDAKNKPAADIFKMKEADALDAIEETLNADLLKDWARTAKGKLAKAIEAQLDTLKKDKPS